MFFYVNFFLLKDNLVFLNIRQLNKGQVKLCVCFSSFLQIYTEST